MLRKKKLVLDELVDDISESEYESESEDEHDYSVEDIKQAIEELPQGYRVVFNLFMFEEYTHKQIAEMLEISESTAKSQLFKAKRKLKEILLQKKK